MDGVIAYFDSMADRYDDASSADGWSVNEHLDRVLSGLTRAPRRVLDLGAGTGRTSEVVARHFPDARIDLVEGSPQMAERARTTVPGAHVHVADLHDYLAETQVEFDLVVALGVLEFVADLSAVLARVATMLSPQGVLVLTYEPIVHGHVEQADPETTIPLPGGPLVIRRHHLGEVHDALAAAGVAVTSSELIVAYHRGGAAPAVYDLVVGGLASQDRVGGRG